jgi:uncharacterized protein
MRAFIDTSTLFKKYVDERGSEEFNKILDSVSEIIVSPITLLEINSVIERRLRERTLKPADGKWIYNEFLTDYDFFAVVRWNDDLVKESVRIIRTYQIRVLDAIHLSAALISKASLFLTSDKRLYESAKNEISDIRFI